MGSLSVGARVGERTALGAHREHLARRALGGHSHSPRAQHMAARAADHTPGTLNKCDKPLHALPVAHARLLPEPATLPLSDALARRARAAGTLTRP